MTLKDIIEIVEAAKGRGYSTEDQVKVLIADSGLPANIVAVDLTKLDSPQGRRIIRITVEQ